MKSHLATTHFIFTKKILEGQIHVFHWIERFPNRPLDNGTDHIPILLNPISLPDPNTCLTLIYSALKIEDHDTMCVTAR